MAGDSFVTRLQDELRSGDAQFRPHFQVPGIGVDDLCKRGLAGVGYGCTLVGG